MSVRACAKVAFSLVAVGLWPTTSIAQQFLDQRPAWLGRQFRPVDWDADGDTDVLTAEWNGVTLWRNDGQNRFPVPTVISPLVTDATGAVADFDGDGDKDIVVWTVGVTSGPGMSIFLLRNGGASAATAQVFIPPVACGQSAFLEPIDIDGDGDLDIVAAAYPIGSLTVVDFVLANDGTGGFTDVTSVCWPALTGSSARARTLDVDGDGRQDLLLHSNDARLLRNTGAGFVDETALRLPPLTSPVVALAVGDIEPDGDPDLVLAAGVYAGAGLYVDTAGVFVAAPAAALPLPHAITTAAFFDADQDQDLDLLVDYSLGAGSGVLRNLGGGVFQAPIASPGFGSASAVMVREEAFDLEGDGDEDVVRWGTNGYYGMLRNDGTGVLADVLVGTPPMTVPIGALVDLDGDGDLDGLQPPGWQENDGFGAFTFRPQITGVPVVGQRTHAADLDGDNDLDIVSTWIHRNNGNGTFTMLLVGVPAQLGPSCLGDFDGDGIVDIATLASAGQTTPGIRIWRNSGSATFTQLTQVAVPLNVGSIDCGDLDGDGDLDIVVGGGGSMAKGAVYRNDGIGGLTFASAIGGVFDVQFADITGTGRADILTVPAGVWRWQGGAVVEVTGAVIPTGFVAGWRMAVGDIDGDGDLDVCGDQLLRNDGTGSLSMEALGTRAYEPYHQLADLDGDGDLDLLSTLGSTRGRVSWNREHQLWLPLPAHTGRNLRVEVSAHPGRAPTGEFAVIGVGLQRDAIGVATPFGALRIGSIGLTFVMPVTPVAGTAEADLPIPPVPGIVGIDLHLQALHVGPSGLLLGNVASTRIE